MLIAFAAIFGGAMLATEGPANAVRPGKRMLSSMSPTIAWKDGEIVAVGGRGGSRIPTAVTQVLLGLLFGLGAAGLQVLEGRRVPLVR